MKTFKQFQEGIGKYVVGGALLATPYLLKKFAKPKVDKQIKKSRDESPIGANKRMRDIENAAGAPGFFDK
jgi:hypothetical protein